jgi:hypothetical protein
MLEINNGTDIDSYQNMYLTKLKEYSKLVTEKTDLFNVPFCFRDIFIQFNNLQIKINDYFNELKVFNIKGDSIWEYSSNFIIIHKLMASHPTINIMLLLYILNQHLFIYGDEDSPTQQHIRKSIIVTKLGYIQHYIDNMYKNDKITSTKHPFKQAQIKLNGKQLFTCRDAEYFNYVVPYKSYQRTPDDGYYVYSFALHPLEYQPSGTANMSVLKDSTLKVILNEETLMNQNKLLIMGRRYSLLRIMSGIGGLVWRN